MRKSWNLNVLCKQAKILFGDFCQRLRQETLGLRAQALQLRITTPWSSDGGREPLLSLTAARSGPIAQGGWQPPPLPAQSTPNLFQLLSTLLPKERKLFVN